MTRSAVLALAGALCSVHASPIIIEEPPHFGGDVMFATGSVELPADARRRLRLALRRGHAIRNACVVVIGHADPFELGVLSTQELSSGRADAVAAIFQADGYESGRIYVESKGATQPVAAPPSLKNSRVEVDVYPC